MFSTIDSLRANLGVAPRDTAYDEKMMHPIPDAAVVDREQFIVDTIRGKTVIEFGASGALHGKITAAASVVVGVDRDRAPGVIGFDLDAIGQDLPVLAKPNWIVCGEVIEHLSNPGYFLSRLKHQYGGVPMIITVPNAFTDVGRKTLDKGIENVNRDHVAWYSYTTLKTLLTRAGYTIRELYWYGGKPYYAQGLVVVVD